MATRRDDDHHLHFLVTEPGCDPCQRVVVVNFTSRKQTTIDCSCVVDPGEHPMVSQPSVVKYDKARILNAAGLASFQMRNLVARRPPLSPQLLERVIAGFAVSIYVPRDPRRMLEVQGLLVRA